MGKTHRRAWHQKAKHHERTPFFCVRCYAGANALTHRNYHGKKFCGDGIIIPHICAEVNILTHICE
jgi:hypothetical protein